MNKFKKLYQKGKELVNLFSDVKKILILFQFTKDETLSFTDLQQELRISSSLLSYDLKKMMNVGFVQKISKKEPASKKFSFYTLTQLGKKVISQIFYPL